MIEAEPVAKYSNRITDSENFELLVIFVARISHFASQSVQIPGKLTRQLNFATVSVDTSHLKVNFLALLMLGKN